MAGTPPDVVAQPSADQFCVPARFQYTVLGAGKVTPELPPQSPARVGEPPAAVPAIVMSLKSQSSADRVPTVRVRVVPTVLLRNMILRTADAPATVRVPVMVWSAVKDTWRRPAGAVIDRLLKVLDWLIV